MNLKECYAALGGDYEGVVTRLGGEQLIRKFVRKFLIDESYSLLCQSLEEDDHKDAFRAAHTLKGICQSLHFTQLYESCSSLCDMFHAGAWRPEVDDLVDRVKSDHMRVVQAIQQLDGEISQEAEAAGGVKEEGAWNEG